jgi:hypothetical protein
VGIRGRWLGWAAPVLGVGLFVPFVGFLALLLSAVWIVVAGVALFRARDAVGKPRIVAPRPALEQLHSPLSFSAPQNQTSERSDGPEACDRLDIGTSAGEEAESR